MTSKLRQIAGQSHVLTVTRLKPFSASCQQGPRPAPRCHPHSWPHGPTILQFSNGESPSYGIPLSPWTYLDSQLTRTDSPKKTSFLKPTMPPNITTFQKWHQGHSCQGGGPGAIWEFCLLYLVFAYYIHLSSACISLPAPHHLGPRLEADIISQGELTSQQRGCPEVKTREQTWNRSPTHH